LDILSEAWQGSSGIEESVISHVVSIPKKLEVTMKQVENNLKTAQEQQSYSYNQKVREREFVPDDQVLILLPTTQSRLMAKWQGPY